MNYEKKYKEALANARQEYTTTENVERKQWLEELFPELAESEDEKIRKTIIDFVNEYGDKFFSTLAKGNAIAWLEKQGDTTSDIRYDGINAGASLSVVNDKPFDYERATITQNDFASVGETATIELSSPIDCGDRIYHVSHKPIEKQGEQKVSVADFKAKDWYVSKVDGKIHDMTYNPTDKVEPKFKIGDWIVNDYCMGRVVELTNDAYLLDTEQGIPFSYEHNVHLWTIEDAKDGDVLVDKYGNIGIYQGDKNAVRWNSYCYCGVNKGFYDGGSHEFPCYPATKEQRDLLFQKMKEAGYTFDFEKKELKKPQRMISAEAKEALYDKVVEPKFKNGQWIVWQDKCYKVNYNGCGYELVDQNGLSTSLEYGTIDENAHFWDITKDAKDGDVVVNGSNIFVFHFTNETRLMGYCHVNVDDMQFYNDIGKNECFCLIDAEVSPATKEQRELLFQKMKEAGYQWDAEKKELKLLITNGGDFKQKQEWSEEDDYNLQCVIAKVTSDIQKGNVGRNNELIDWLKSLKDKIKA